MVMGDNIIDNFDDLKKAKKEAKTKQKSMGKGSLSPSKTITLWKKVNF